jgi:hypothetical protein
MVACPRMPPYGLCQRSNVDWLTSKACNTLARSLPALSIASASRNLCTICSSECRFLRLVIVKVSLPYGPKDLHNRWISFSTAGQSNNLRRRRNMTEFPDKWRRELCPKRLARRMVQDCSEEMFASKLVAQKVLGTGAIIRIGPEGVNSRCTASDGIFEQAE